MVMLLRKYWWVGAALACVLLGWLLRGWAGQPVDANTRALLDTLQATRQQYTEATDQRRDALQLLAETNRLLTDAQYRTDSVAEVRYREAQRHRAQAGALEGALAAATSAADSVPILVTQKAGLSAALDTMERVVTELEASRSILGQRNENLVSQLGLYREQRHADSTRLHLQALAIQGLEKAKSPCGRWCPTLIGTYEVRDAALAVGAGVRIKSWLTVGATYRVN